jgi:hypothetical protein
MHQEGAIADFADHNPRYAAHRLQQRFGMIGVVSGACHVDA